MDAEMEEVKKLYISFRKSLLNGDVEKFYDEVDLLNIYDFAIDENDLFVQFEILRLAARMFPDSPEFGSRGAFFLKDVLDDPEGSRALASQHRNDSFAWSMLNLSFEADSEKVRSGIESAMRHRGMLEDDDVLRLIDLLDEYKLQDWAYENYEKILSLCVYPDTFLLELAELFYNQGKYDEAIVLLERLTEIQPFNAVVWSRLADTHALNRNLDGALSSVDYAIAIDPDKTEYRVQRVRLKYYCGTPSDKDMAQLYDVLEKEPANMDAINILFAIMIDRGEYSKVIDMMIQRLDECKEDAVAIDLAEKLFLLNNRQVVKDVLNKYFANGSVVVPDKLGWAQRQFRNGCYAACAEIILSLIGAPLERAVWDMLFESLYRIKDYKGLADLFIDSDTGIRTVYQDTEEALFPMFIMALALVRTEHYAEFREVAEFLINDRPVVVEDFKQRLAVSAAFSILHALMQFLSNGTDFDIDAFDPFTE